MDRGKTQMENDENINIPSLEELKSIIREEAPFIAKKPYSIHTVNISLILMASKYGEEEVESIINELNLDKKGWEDFLERSQDSEISQKERNLFHAKCIKDFREMNR